MSRNRNHQPIIQPDVTAIAIPATEPAEPITHHIHQTDHVFHAIMAVIETRDADRQALEDIRSIKRNRNRLAGLLGALFISLILTWSFQHNLPTPPVAKLLSPYSFVITITLDAGILAYAYFKRY